MTVNVVEKLTKNIKDQETLSESVKKTISKDYSVEVGEKITYKSNVATHKTVGDYNIESGTIVTIQGTDEVKLT